MGVRFNVHHLAISFLLCLMAGKQRVDTLANEVVVMDSSHECFIEA